jgi:hypothetical protein
MIRRHLNYANVVATLALVFAMSGGALAASHYLITSTKQIKPTVLKSLKGANGTNGTNGANGVNGAPGEKGAAGSAGAEGKEGKAGASGTNGQSVTSAEIKASPKNADCKEGGSEFTSASGKSYACNGEKGVLHAGETLAPEATETGEWGYMGPGGHHLFLPISFPIPLPAIIQESNIVVVKEGQEGQEPGCGGGKAEAPKANPGYLCIYVGANAGFEADGGHIGGGEGEPSGLYPVLSAEGPATATNTTGGLLNLFEEGAEQGRGTWAVTAPAS